MWEVEEEILRQKHIDSELAKFQKHNTQNPYKVCDKMAKKACSFSEYEAPLRYTDIF